jgi:CheY-like chemotaxis protein
MQRIESPSALRILVADDEVMIAQMWEIIFRQLGFQVAVCFDGRAAIRKARTWHPDLVVTDMAMPRMDGVHAALRVHKPGCAIVILSASSEGSEELKLIRRHHLGTFISPFHRMT